MQLLEPIENGNYYHIYNCGINGEKLFRENRAYEYFLSSYDKYIDPVADTFAWCLMGNHFHLLVRVKEEEEIGFYKQLNSDRSNDSVRFQVTSDLSEFREPDRVKKPNPTKHSSHLFNAYTRYYNKKYNRIGSLFIQPFKRKQINNEKYFRQLVIYIHNNPVHHGFVEHPVDYPWSSYLSCVSVKPAKLQRETVIRWFDDVANFKEVHEGKVEFLKIGEWLGV